MKNEISLNKNKQKPFEQDETLKATALIYLRDALVNEKYEEAADCIKQAKRFGASQEEINAVLGSYTQNYN